MAYLRDLRIRISGRRRGSERGASLVEYALLLALIAMVSIAAVTTLGGVVSDTMEDGGNGISGSSATTVVEFQCRPGHEHHWHCRNEIRP